MTAYWAYFSARFRQLLQYRAAAAAGFATQLFWGFIRVMIFGAFYAASTHPAPMTYREVVTYVWLGQAMLMLVPWSVDTELFQMIRSGNVAYELLRPLDLYRVWYARSLALRTAPTLLRSVPMFVIAGLFFGLQAPPSVAAGAAWAVATVCAAFLAAAISTLVTISLMWTIAGDGVRVFVGSAVMLCSGLIVPLPLFPAWAQPVLNALPFRHVMDTPFRLYMGHIPAGDAPFIVAQQIAWTVALVYAGRYLMARGTRRLVIQGG